MNLEIGFGFICGRKDFQNNNILSCLLKTNGLFQVKERIKNNAYKLDLLGERNACATFNVFDLSFFDVGDDLRMNPFEEKANNDDQRASLKDPLHMPIRPITCAKA